MTRFRKTYQRFIGFAIAGVAAALAFAMAPSAFAAQAASTNWAGLAAVSTSRIYAGVGATWTIPSVDMSNGGALAEWVGIDGAVAPGATYNSNDILQAGVTDSGQGPYAWLEAYPASPIPLPIAASVGDSVTVSIVRQDHGVWLLSFDDLTTAGHYQRMVDYIAHNYSAECIVEIPSRLDGSRRPMPAFGSVPFSECWGLVGSARAPVTQLPNVSFAIVSPSGQPLVAPIDTTPAGGFTVVHA